MSSKRARKPKGEINAAADLLAALKFISIAQRKDGLAYQTACTIGAKYVQAFDGILAAGHKIDEDLEACPDTLKLINVLSKCGEEVAITQDNNRLSIKSGPFSAFVSCSSPEQMISVVPDPAEWSCDARLIQAFETVTPLTDEKSQDVWASSVLLKSGSATSSNGHFLIEYWHGIDFPECLIPASSADAILKVKKNPVKFGYSGKTLTLWFDDESWIKTLLIDDERPDLSTLLDVKANPWPIPENFFKAIDAVGDINSLGSVFFFEDCVCSEASKEVGAKYEIEGLPAGKIYASKYLKMLKPLANNIDFMLENRCMFFGENLRGIIMERVI